MSLLISILTIHRFFPTCNPAVSHNILHFCARVPARRAELGRANQKFNSRNLGARGVKKLERTSFPMNIEFTYSVEVGIWAEIESNLDGGGEKSLQNDRTAQQ